MKRKWIFLLFVLSSVVQAGAQFIDTSPDRVKNTLAGKHETDWYHKATKHY